jgi:hypothetical protein
VIERLTSFLDMSSSGHSACCLELTDRRREIEKQERDVEALKTDLLRGIAGRDAFWADRDKRFDDELMAIGLERQRLAFEADRHSKEADICRDDRIRLEKLLREMSLALSKVQKPKRMPEQSMKLTALKLPRIT